MVAAPSGSPPAADTIKCTCVSCKGKCEEMRESMIDAELLYKLKRSPGNRGFKVLKVILEIEKGKQPLFSC